VTGRLPHWGLERRVTLVAALAVILAPLNSTMIAVALPRIIDGFSITVPAAGWLVTGYLISMASMQPLAGKLGDRFGRRRVMLLGLVAFGVASLLAAFAPNYQTLLAARFLQALAGASSLPNGAALVRELVPAERRGRGFGMVGIFAGLAAASGPPLGGLLVDLAGWRSIFLVNVPVVSVALLAGWFWIPAPRRAAMAISRTPRPDFDYLGAVMLPSILVGAASLLIFGARGLAGPWIVAAWSAAVVGGLIAFVKIESRQPDPIVRPSMYRSRTFSAASLAIGLSNLAMYTTLLGVPILLGARATHSDLQIGLVLTGLSMGMAVLAPISGRLADRYGRRLPTLAGLGIMTAGSLLLAINGAGIALWMLVLSLLVSGVGLGLAGTGMQTGAVESVPASQAGAGSGMSSTSRYFGSILGSAILAGLIGAAGPSATGFDELFIVIAIASALSAAAALAMQAWPHAGDEGAAEVSIPGEAGGRGLPASQEARS
jgi:EmrB/QacA subfamily drug resistance transporter